MNSKIPDDLLSAFLDRELTAAEEASVSNHLKSSPQSRQELQDYQRLSELLRELPRLKAPSEFASSVMQRAERETLIPLDPAPSGGRVSSREKPSRRALVLIAVGAVAASIAVLVVVARPPRRNEEALVAKAAALGDREAVRTVEAPAAADVTERVAVAASPARTPTKPTAPAVGILGVVPALKTAAADRKESKAGASFMYGGAAEGKGVEIVLPADLKTAKVGDVIEAMEKVGDQVAVVRLTVVNQTAGLGQLQSLLWREPTHSVEGKQSQKTMEAKQKEAIADEFSLGKDKSPAGGQGTSTKNKSGELICVFIEESREELADLLKDMQAERRIQQAELTNTISVEKLAQYANHPVAQSTAAHASSRAQTVLSLSANAVSQILTDNRRPASPTADKKGVSPLAVNSLALRHASKKQPGAAKSPTTETEAVSNQSLGLAAAEKQFRSAQKTLAATTQRPIQVFFVLDDQSVAQSVSDAAKAPTAAPAEPAPVSRASESKAGKRSHRRPVTAQRPAKPPAEKAD